MVQHDACGVGFVVDIKGRKSNKILKDALQVLKNLDHRGACGCEANTGDGAGVLIQMPHGYFKEVCAKARITLPGPGEYGSGLIFLPRDRIKRRRLEERFEQIVQSEGQVFLGWRTVPTNNSMLGETARSCEPMIRQVFISRDPANADPMAFERKLYVIRKRSYNEIRTSTICVGSGKGGVGKSTLTANLAAALSAEGKRVGVLDADVWGYSIPRMFGLGATRPDVSAERKIIPLVAHGVRVMSIGFFVEEDAAVVWRGPMLHKALTQFLQDVDWGSLDYLLVDLPPGTGDVSMTLAQLLPQAKFLIVTTPQQTAQKVARRSAQMAEKVDLEIAGVVENMSSFTTPSGERFQIFGDGGGQELADELDVPLLGKIPLTMPLREQADAGSPLVAENPDDPAAQAIRQVARGLIAIAPPALPTLPLVEVAVAPAPAESRKPVGMSLPMA